MTANAILRLLGVRLALLTLLTMAVTGASAQTYVDASCGDDANTGATPDCGAPDGPKLTIQAGIDAGGFVVSVAPGTYYERVDASAHHLYSSGGAEVTIIDGTGINGNAVVFHCNLETGGCGNSVPGFTLEGFTVTGGDTGVRLTNSSITRDCVITGNAVGFRCQWDLGGVSIVEHSIISNNSLGMSGNPPCVIKNSLITNNDTGVEIWGELINSTVVGNGIGLRGNTDEGYFTVYNSVMWDYPLIVDEGEDFEYFFANSIIQDHDQHCSSDFVVCVDSSGADPLFVDESLGDYRLSSGSPAIDAGTNDPVDWSTDLDGNPRIVGPAPATVDIGAYEYPAPPAAAGTVSGLVVDKSGIDLLLSWDADCGLGEAYGIYRGDLDLGYASIAPDSCDISTTEATLTMGVSPGEFFLIVPAWGGLEGSYGSASGGRPPAVGACHPQGGVDGCAP